jgi:DNA-binding PadR family transcriptional regulator
MISFMRSITGTRFLFPQARVYTLLHDLLDNGYLEIRVSGKSKLYCPTETGKNISARNSMTSSRCSSIF